MMNGKYETNRSLGGARYLYDASKFTVAVFSVEIGDAAFEAVKHQIAKDGGSLFDMDRGEYLAGSVDQLSNAE